ncbi:MAG: hypothetical protein ACXWT3_04195 [Methylococcaceae bacterium]
MSLAILSVLLLPTVNSRAAETTIVSVDPAGLRGNSGSFYPAISANGRFVAFASYASNLVAGDTNDEYDIFVRDRTDGTTTRVSIDSAGQQGNLGSSGSGVIAISADGRFVAFESSASNLVAEDTNETNDIFVHDRSTGATNRVSVDSAGGQGNGESSYPAISADGRFVAFASAASNLVVEATSGYGDVFVHDRTTGITTLVSVDSAGLEGIYGSGNPSISADGRFVAFTSESSNLVTGDTNGWADTFVHDRATGITTRVSVGSAGEQGNYYSNGTTSISADGRWVAFLSRASNLVAGDTNDGGTTFATDGIDVFVHDRRTGTTTRVSVNSQGEQQNAFSAETTISISADGRFVAFSSMASNLVTGGERDNNQDDIFVHDRITRITTRASVNPTGEQGNIRHSGHPAISADGRFVTFGSTYLHAPVEDPSFAAANEILVRDRLLIANKTADLQLAVTSQPASVQTGQPANYTYTLSNNGPDNINTEVKLTDVISKGRFISLTPSQGSCNKAVVSVCRFGHLATGSNVTLTVVIKANGNPLTQQLSVNAPPVDNAPDNNSITVATPVTP